MTRNPTFAKPFRPREYAEHRLITSILNGTYPPGAALPAERSLAESLGITRPTLRETLQRLSREGWIRIRHGKSSVVSDYWRNGGLSLLSTLATYGEFLPDGFVGHLLEVRLSLMPGIAGLAVARSPGQLKAYLAGAKALDDGAEAFAAYDWQLQVLMTRSSGNPIFTLILNDFAAIYQTMGHRYFSLEQGRLASRAYYRELTENLENDHGSVEDTVRRAMLHSKIIWQGLYPAPPPFRKMPETSPCNEKKQV